MRNLNERMLCGFNIIHKYLWVIVCIDNQIDEGLYYNHRTTDCANKEQAEVLKTLFIKA